MRKFIIKALLSGLNLFESVIINKFPSEWVKRISKLTVSRFKLFGEALIDSDPNDKEQLEKIAKETIGSTEFAELEKFAVSELATKIPNAKLAEVLLSTESLRLNFYLLLTDEDTNNNEQIKQLFEDFLHSEDFDKIAITLTELLADKYAKNPTVKEFLISLVTTLVNSDDDENIN